MNAVNRMQYKKAKYSLDKINPALIALREALNPQVVGHSNMPEIVKFHDFLKGVRDDCLAVVDTGNTQFEGRDVELINKASLRMFEIPRIIEVEEKRMEHLLNSREIKVAQLKKNFTSDEIDRITPPIPQSDVDDSKAVVAALKAEAEAIKRFLNDSPMFDIALLDGTSLEQISEVAA